MAAKEHESWHRAGAWHQSRREGIVAATVPTDALPATVQIMTPHGKVAITDLCDGDTLTIKKGDECLNRTIREVTQYFWVGGDHPDKGVLLALFPSVCEEGGVFLPTGWAPCDSRAAVAQSGLTPSSFYQLTIEDFSEQNDALILNDVACRLVERECDQLRSWRFRVNDQDAEIHDSRNDHSLIRLPAGSSRVTMSGSGMGRNWRGIEITLWDSDGMRAVELSDSCLSGDQISIELDRDPQNVGFLSIRA